ncbi:MAG: DUF4364 family protein [Epulopiscium sp.]|nr:DUF4364 family protein [Candidatus Epulonipiscium sp.]
MIQSTQELTLNKLIILFLIHHMRIPLSNTQITEFILERNYTDYFSIQQYLSELVEAKLLLTQIDNHTTRYVIESKGERTLEYFLNRIPVHTREEIMQYIQTHRPQIRQEIEITAEYIPEKQNEYLVICKVVENETLLMELKVNVVSKEQAKKICNNWKQSAQVHYGQILSSLTNPTSKDKKNAKNA